MLYNVRNDSNGFIFPTQLHFGSNNHIHISNHACLLLFLLISLFCPALCHADVPPANPSANLKIKSKPKPNPSSEGNLSNLPASRCPRCHPLISRDICWKKTIGTSSCSLTSQRNVSWREERERDHQEAEEEKEEEEEVLLLLLLHTCSSQSSL